MFHAFVAVVHVDDVSGSGPLVTEQGEVMMFDDGFIQMKWR